MAAPSYSYQPYAYAILHTMRAKGGASCEAPPFVISVGYYNGVIEVGYLLTKVYSIIPYFISPVN